MDSANSLLPLPTWVGNCFLNRWSGQGSYGDVYLGTLHPSGRPVAVKVLRSSLASQPIFLARFQAEARRAMSLPPHPNIVRVLSVASSPSGTSHINYIVMDAVAGSTLRSLLATERRLPWRRSLQIVQQIAEALAIAHAHQLMHGDIKPENVMISADTHVTVLDFGLARPIRLGPTPQSISSGISGEPPDSRALLLVVGTLPYLAPELVNLSQPNLHLQADPSADVFSLGICLYELVRGILPYSRAVLHDHNALFNFRLRQGALAPLFPEKGEPSTLSWLYEQMTAPERLRRPTAVQVATSARCFLRSLQVSQEERQESAGTNAAERW